MKKAIAYVRVSTSGQAEDGVSLEAQEARIRAWCTLEDYDLADVFIDRGLSGGRADNRPALQEALQVVGRGDALVVYSLSRLARSTKDTLAIAETLDRRGADLVSLSEKIETTSAAGKMVFRLLAVLSEFERDVIAERTSMAMRHLQAQGRHIGGHVPFGFLVVDRKLVASTYEQEAMKFAKNLRDLGFSLRSIAQVLEEHGFLSRTGFRFDPKQVSRMITSKCVPSCPHPTETTKGLSTPLPPAESLPPDRINGSLLQFSPNTIDCLG